MPVAVPDPPVELDQVTWLTPILSLAVPLTTSEVAEVAILVLAGDKIVSDGGVVSGPGVGLGCEGFPVGGFVVGGFGWATC